MQKLTNIIIRREEDKVFYFDEANIYRSCDINVAKSINVRNTYRLRRGIIHINNMTRFVELDKFKNPQIVRIGIKRLKEGETIENLYKYIENIEQEKKLSYDELEFFIISIKLPEFVRENGNKKKKAFDFIYINVLLPTEWEQKEEYVKENLKEINKSILREIEKNYKFKRMGIPINFFKISKVTLNKTKSEIHYILELKDI